MTIESSEAVRRFCAAIGNLAGEMLSAGIPTELLAAGLRIEAGKLEYRRDRAPMLMPDEREMVDLARKAHEFINVQIVAGIDERAAIVVFTNALIERVVRTQGAAGGAHWLRNLAAFVDANGDSFETTAQAA